MGGKVTNLRHAVALVLDKFEVSAPVREILQTAYDAPMPEQLEDMQKEAIRCSINAISEWGGGCDPVMLGALCVLQEMVGEE